MGKGDEVRGNEGMEKREGGEAEGPSSQIFVGSQQCKGSSNVMNVEF